MPTFSQAWRAGLVLLAPFAAVACSKSLSRAEAERQLAKMLDSFESIAEIAQDGPMSSSCADVLTDGGDVCVL